MEKRPKNRRYIETYTIGRHCQADISRFLACGQPLWLPRISVDNSECGESVIERGVQHFILIQLQIFSGTILLLANFAAHLNRAS
jgi:hypothetical protein